MPKATEAVVGSGAVVGKDEAHPSTHRLRIVKKSHLGE
jgi:hypothetical protein